MFTVRDMYAAQKLGKHDIMMQTMQYVAEILKRAQKSWSVAVEEVDF